MLLGLGANLALESARLGEIEALVDEGQDLFALLAALDENIAKRSRAGE